MSANIGPTAGLPASARRIGRSGKVFRDGAMLGEVITVEWSIEMEQIAVPIAGTFRDENKPGGESLRGSITVQDLHDRWMKEVLDFISARRNGDRSAAAFPEFSIMTVLDDIGAPLPTRVQLDGCQIYSAEGGFSITDDLITRDIPFSFRTLQLVDGFEYTDAGVTPVTA